MSERQEKKRRIENRLQYLNKLEVWLAEELEWWRIFARQKWRARRPRRPKYYWGGYYAGE